MVMDLRSHFIHRIKGTTAREIITDGLTPVCVLQQLMLHEEEEKKGLEALRQGARAHDLSISSHDKCCEICVLR